MLKVSSFMTNGCGAITHASTVSGMSGKPQAHPTNRRRSFRAECACVAKEGVHTYLRPMRSHSIYQPGSGRRNKMVFRMNGPPKIALMGTLV